jgi:hypothetical protein
MMARTAAGVLAARVAALAVLAIVACEPGSPTPTPPTTAEARLVAATQSVGLPPLPRERADVYDYYDLAFLEDGFPARRTKAGAVPHPIYGTYLILDYLDVHERSGDPAALAAARRVADAAIARMDPSEGMLRFWYEAEWGLGSTGERYVSGLTQAHYLDQFSRLHAICGEPAYADAARRVFRSLATDVEHGGVLASTPHGVAIEESPHRPRDLVLNGWLSALRGLRRYADRTGDEEARELIRRNVETLSRLLPLYDAPQEANSRYRIRGFGYVRLELGSDKGVALDLPRLEIPGDGTYELEEAGKGRWHCYVVSGLERDGDRLRATARRIQLNLVFSLLSAPEPNRLRLSIDCPVPNALTVRLATGRYDPLQTGLVTDGWRDVLSMPLAAGRNDLTVEFTVEDIKPFVYPTNFLKRIAGRKFNAYHFVHLDGLADLLRSPQPPMVGEMRDRWAAYPARWPAMPVYRDAGVEFSRYGQAPRD